MRHHIHHDHHHGYHHGHAGFSPRHGHGGHGGHGGHPGRGGRPGGFGFSDDGGLPRGRKLSSDDLQLLLLVLIAEQPSHGYELIRALDARSNGFYVPSPGMMYPALACMEDLGWVTIELEGTRKRYALSDEGRAHLDANRAHVDMLLARLQEAAQKMDLMRSALAEGEEGPRGRGAWTAELSDARHALKRALMTRAGAGADEQRRIAAILVRAAADIEQGAGAGDQGGGAGR
jgi:DNA-binding PadR family transcriptional regulator